jgi:superfamily II RNA helicase
LIEYNGLKLDPFQESAIRHIDECCSVLVSAPTGSGKTIIAEYALEKALRAGKHIIYTAPIKALSNQKFRDFQKRWSDHIGLVTGDININPEAPVTIMTTEIFRNTIFDSPARLAKVDYVIFDEIHFIDDPERGTVWEESIIFAPPHIKILALSATVPNIQQIARWIRTVRQTPLVVMEETARPVPLKHLCWSDSFGIANLKDLHQMEKGIKLRRNRMTLLEHLVAEDQLPCLHFIFHRKGCEEQAERQASRCLLSADEQARIMEMFNRLCRQYEVEPNKIRSLGRLISCGVAYHHAGMLPTLKEIVEQLFTSGLIKLLFATETFAVGVNMPAKSVVFDSISKFDGIRRTYLTSRDYHQMAGRAGRRGIDPVGFVYLKLPPAPVRASVIEHITSDDLEPVKSQFNLSYNCILNLYHTLKDNIYTAAEKSLSNFQSHGGKHHHKSPVHQRRYRDVVNKLRQKLGLLNRLGYINNKTLTDKGLIARQIYSSELVLTEFLVQGFLAPLSPDQINILMVAIVFESRRRDWHKHFDHQILRAIHKPARRILDRIRAEENKFCILPPVKELDFKLSGAVYAWSSGALFENLRHFTSASEGDIIRTFRQALQLIRHLLRLARHHPAAGPLAEKLLRQST